MYASVSSFCGNVCWNVLLILLGGIHYLTLYLFHILRAWGILRGYTFNAAAIMALLNMIIFCDCYMLDRYLNTRDLFIPKSPPIYYNATAFHTPPAAFLMQTITVCGPHYCKHEFLSHCDFISSTLIITILCQLKAVNMLLKGVLVAARKKREKKKKGLG